MLVWKIIKKRFGTYKKIIKLLLLLYLKKITNIKIKERERNIESCVKVFCTTLHALSHFVDFSSYYKNCIVKIYFVIK